MNDTPLREKYRVWDPFDESHVRDIVASSRQDAAETYAEDDIDGQRAGLYEDGHALHVIDPEGDAWEVFVAVERQPLGAALKTRRLS